MTYLDYFRSVIRIFRTYATNQYKVMLFGMPNSPSSFQRRLYYQSVSSWTKCRCCNLDMDYNYNGRYVIIYLKHSDAMTVNLVTNELYEYNAH